MEDMLAKIFTEARTHSHWLERDVSDEVLKKIFDIAQLGPTSANSQPLRMIFLRTLEEKEKLKTCLDAGNVHKTMTAPVVVIFAYDLKFYEELPKLFPHFNMKPYFEGKENLIEETAKLNSSLQSGYFMLAARSQGVDCGPMSGFNTELCDKLFFAGTNIKSYYLCNLGYGDKSKLFPRLPRKTFDEACKIL